MKLKSINKVHEGKFITRYDIAYETVNGNEKIYEMISRDHAIHSASELQSKEPEAVVIIMHSTDGNKILLNKEFRLATGQWVYNFPAGLIDEGEDAKQSAIRELHEETGLDILEITDTIGVSYSAVGFSNEKNVCVVGIADGHFSESTSEVEEIKPGWYSKEEVRELLKNNMFAARTQAYCYMWSKA